MPDAGRVPVLSAEQATAWDRHARDAGVPSRVLMEAAGRAAATVIADEFGSVLDAGVLIVAGHGNNGGDAWVIGRALQATGVPVWAATTEGDATPDCRANRDLALADGVVLVEADGPWPPVAVIVDGLLGTGASGPVRGEVGDLARRVSEEEAAIVAVDGPTGLDLSTGEPHGPVRADLTVTFGGFRRGHLGARDWCGRIVVVEIGFGATWPALDWPVWVDETAVASVLPDFHAGMHKGDRGRLVIVGGQAGMAGAAAHAARAALASGVGLVKIAAAPESIPALQSVVPDAMCVPTSLDGEPTHGLLDLLEWADAIVIGPGLGRSPGRAEFVTAVMEASDRPMIVDADALQVGLDPLSRGRAPRIMTPHPGEFRAVFPDLPSDDPYGATREAQARWAEHSGSETTVLLKGVPTLIVGVDGGTRVVGRGNPGLATGGSGDVLAGIIGASLAQTVSVTDAAVLGAFAMGVAAESAAADVGVRSMRPGDVTEALAEVWRSLAEPARPSYPRLATVDPPSLA